MFQTKQALCCFSDRAGKGGLLGQNSVSPISSFYARLLSAPNRSLLQSYATSAWKAYMAFKYRCIYSSTNGGFCISQKRCFRTLFERFFFHQHCMNQNRLRLRQCFGELLICCTKDKSLPQPTPKLALKKT